MNDFFKKTNLYQHRLFRLMVFILLFFCASIWSEAGYALQCWSSFNGTSLSTDNKVVIPYTVDNGLSKNASTTKGSITVTCSFAASEQSATVCSQLAATKNDTDTFRTMTDSNNNTVLFNVYTDVNYTNIWGYKSGGNAQYPKSFSINNILVAKLTNTNYLKSSFQTSTTLTFYVKSMNYDKNMNSIYTGTSNSFNWSRFLSYYYVNNTIYSCDAGVTAVNVIQSGKLYVNESVDSGCYVSADPINMKSTTSDSIDFGTQSQSAFKNDLKNSGTMYMQCTNGTPYMIGMGIGKNSTGSGASLQRYLIKGTTKINYGLYVDSAYTTPWSDISGSVSCSITGQCLSGTGTGLVASFPIYAMIPKQNTPPPLGTYTDTVTVTISY